MEFDIAIRHFLTKCGFRLPGESQKIDRLVTAFGTIMLNSDAHNPNVPVQSKMTLEQFLRNNRDIDDGKPLDKVCENGGREG